MTELDSATDLSKHRLVFLYGDIYLQVWFKDGHVTGVTQKGISIVKLKDKKVQRGFATGTAASVDRPQS